MKVFYSPAHLEHAPPEEFEGGRMAPAVEVPGFLVVKVERGIATALSGAAHPPNFVGGGHGGGDMRAAVAIPAIGRGRR